MLYCVRWGGPDPSKFLPEDFDTWLVVLVVPTLVHSSW
jgi:hypothetical protein